MPIQITNPPGVKQLLEKDPEYVYVDVRTVAEFEEGHVPGAYNVPISFRTPSGMQPNPDFLAVMKRRFPPGQKIVFG
jgi:rhodanese-related sulfurtransferase